MKLYTSASAALCLPLFPIVLAYIPQAPLTHETQQQPLFPSLAVKPLLDLHRELVEIESITGNEHAVGAYLVAYLKSLNLTVETQRVPSITDADTVAAPWTIHYNDAINAATSSHRFNIYAYPGENRAAHTLLTTHIDTVPPFLPYSISPASSSHNRTISGRGSVDAKASAAAMLTAFSTLHASARKNLALLFVVGEETGGDGMRHASDTLDVTFPTVIFGEPTGGALACGHKGNMGFRVVAKGKAAHSGYPWLGVSANEMLLAALTGVLREGLLPGSDKYGPTTVNVGRIEGGVAANVVAERAEAVVAVRLAGGSPAEARKLVTEAVEGAVQEFVEKGGVVELVWAGEGYGPIGIDCGVEGFEKITVNYGTDIPNFKGKYGKGYLYGPGTILVAHSDHEALGVKDLEEGVEGYKKIILATLDD